MSSSLVVKPKHIDMQKERDREKENSTVETHKCRFAKVEDGRHRCCRDDLESGNNLCGEGEEEDKEEEEEEEDGENMAEKAMPQPSFSPLSLSLSVSVSVSVCLSLSE